jgi:PhnB protein
MNVTPHIVVPEATEAADWYTRAFGAREQSRIPLPGGKVMTVVLELGESTVHVASEFPQAGILSPKSIRGTATVLQINTDDAATFWKQALVAGAEVHEPLQEMFWGDLHGQLDDPFGHRWNVSEHVRDVPHEEIVAAAARLFGSDAGSALHQGSARARPDDRHHDNR